MYSEALPLLIAEIEHAVSTLRAPLLCPGCFQAVCISHSNIPVLRNPLTSLISYVNFQVSARRPKQPLSKPSFRSVPNFLLDHPI